MVAFLVATAGDTLKSKMGLRGANQAITSNLPFLNPLMRTRLPSLLVHICTGESPVVPNLIAPLWQVIHHHQKIRECGHERLRHLGNRVSPDSWRIIR